MLLLHLPLVIVGVLSEVSVWFTADEQGRFLKDVKGLDL